MQTRLGRFYSIASFPMILFRQSKMIFEAVLGYNNQTEAIALSQMNVTVTLHTSSINKQSRQVLTVKSTHEPAPKDDDTDGE